ncbi:DsbA family protein [Alcaligenes nematophilus]|uniref:DsbA family protein n=1 Tax=Alcaligenes faecalis TaxID=511 RepID=A0AAE9H629_ALCFA|nr:MULTISPECIES: DsbA family protein [Alcaligenes]MDH4867596.1 DsbA family protein [Bacillus cereus]KGP01826.1 thioredoxin [Alcaligenes faecalis]MDY7128904.1 DsbA family protein [Alcaligenes nematophilus]UPL20843.1 DsbA family protein [Alcaligenes faecalis]USY26069.1 DsbA family protein [Alcaligenes sp. 1735tsa3]
MNTFNLPARSIVYVQDVYCGWCWGFAERMVEFEAANKHRIPFTAVSGGLFVGDRAAPMSRYPYISESNERIAQMTGATFGAAYKALAEEGSTVMDSLEAATALAVLRAQDPEQAIHWVHELQQAFYLNGRSLSDQEVCLGIAAANGLDVDAVRRHLTDGSGREQALADFALARALGAQSYPTLLYVDGRKVTKLPAVGTPLETLNQTLDSLLG